MLALKEMFWTTTVVLSFLALAAVKTVVVLQVENAVMQERLKIL